MPMMTPNGDEQPEVTGGAASAPPAAASASASTATATATATSTSGASAASGTETSPTTAVEGDREPLVSVGRIAAVITGGALSLALLTWGFWALVATRGEGGYGSTIGDTSKVSGAVGVQQGGYGQGGIVPGGNAQKTAEAAALVTGGAAAQQAGINGGSGSGAASGASGTATSVQNATATCTAALGNAAQISTAHGTTATIGDWAIKATSSVDALRNEAAALATNVATGDQATVASEASKLCTSITSAGQLPAMPDAAGATAWHGALTSFATGAGDALKGAAGDNAAKTAAAAAFTQGAADLKTLSARILATT